VSFPSDCYRKTRRLRIRPVPEREVCLVYTPGNPNLYTLNATAWLVLELCDGRTLAELEKAFHQSVEPLMSEDEASEYLLVSLRDMLEKSIVEVVPSVGAKPARSQRGSIAT
jgi:Coenzyme PQQ synthesis protein D (PqqD)